MILIKEMKMSNIDFNQAIETIKNIAEHNGYIVDANTSEIKIYMEKDRKHAVDFQLWFNSNSHYIQVHRLCDLDRNNGNNPYGETIYSLRNYNDVVIFCNILINSALIRGGVR